MNQSKEEPVEALKPQKRHRKMGRLRQVEINEYHIPLSALVEMCLECVRWIDAKPIVDGIEKYYGRNPPPFVREIIKRVKDRFDKKMHHHRIIKAKKVVMKNPHLESINKITNNKRVKLYR